MQSRETKRSKWDKNKLTAWGMILPTLILFLGLGVFPFVYSIWLSLHSYSLLDPSRGISYVGGKNFLNVLLDKQGLGITIWESTLLTMLYTGICLGLELSIGLGLSVLLSRSRSKHELIRIIIMIPMLLAPAIVGYVFKYMYQYSFGFFNFLLRMVNLPTPQWTGDPTWAKISVIIANLWEWMPFSFLVLLAAIYSIPEDQFEAANVDGATSWQQFLYITLPGIKRAVLVIMLLRGMDLIKTFDLAYVITSGGPGTATSFLSYNSFLLAFKYFEIGEAAAYGFFIVLAVNVIVALFVNILREEGETKSA